MSKLIGKKILIRTNTYHWVGRLEKDDGVFLELSGASFLGDTGRYSTVLKGGWDQHSEIEPVPGEGIALIAISAIVDVVEWCHDLPTDQV